MKSPNLILKVVYFLFLTFFLINCSSSDNDLEDQGSVIISDWQQPTEGFLKAKVDGIAFNREFKSTKSSYTNGGIHYVDYGGGKTNITINVYNFSTKESFNISVDNIGTGKYELTDKNIGLSVDYFEKKSGNMYSNPYIKAEPGKIYGYVTITKFDLTRKEVSGIFEAEVHRYEQTNLNVALIKNITEGEFSGTFFVTKL